MKSDNGSASAVGHEAAARLDATDPLKHYRSRFLITDADLIYLDGNSLGRLPTETKDLLERVTAYEWGDRLIRSWNEGWWELQLRLGEKVRPILGSGVGEVVISDSTSVNLYKLATAAVRHQKGRTRIITDDLNFPTDVYVLDGVARAHDLELVIVPSDGLNGPVDRLLAEIDQDTALVSMSHTVFKSGYTYDMASINEAAHKVGALTLWDLSHSVGSVPIDVGATGADLAVGCTYKYLNGGPGSPAFLYVRTDLQKELENPITAWWAHQEPFAFDLDFVPVNGIRKFHTGTMPTLSLAALEPGLDIVIEAGVGEIRRKSVGLTEFFNDQTETHLAGLGFTLKTPRDPTKRGSHISLSHEEGYAISNALIERAGVIPDFRAPDNIRFGFSPLYTSFTEVHAAVQRMKWVVESGVHRQMAVSKGDVT